MLAANRKAFNAIIASGVGVVLSVLGVGASMIAHLTIGIALLSLIGSIALFMWIVSYAKWTRSNDEIQAHVLTSTTRHLLDSLRR